MKKYLVAIFAVILAVSATAFTTSQKLNDNVYYWYDPQGHALPGGPSTLPPSGCDVGTDICAYGFTEPTDEPLMETPQRIAKLIP